MVRKNSKLEKIHHTHRTRSRMHAYMPHAYANVNVNMDVYAYVDAFKRVVSLGLVTAGLINLLHLHLPMHPYHSTTPMNPNSNRYGHTWNKNVNGRDRDRDATSSKTFRVILSTDNVNVGGGIDSRANSHTHMDESGGSGVEGNDNNDNGNDNDNGSISIVSRSFTSTQQRDFVFHSGHLCMHVDADREIDRDARHDYNNNNNNNNKHENPVFEVYRRLEDVVKQESVHVQQDTTASSSSHGNVHTNLNTNTNMAHEIQNDLYKFCALGSGYASAYMDTNQVFLVNMVGLGRNMNMNTNTNTNEFFQTFATQNYVVVFDLLESPLQSQSQSQSQSQQELEVEVNDNGDVSSSDKDDVWEEGGHEASDHDQIEDDNKDKKKFKFQWVNSSILILGTTESGRRVARAMVQSLLQKANDIMMMEMDMDMDMDAPSSSSSSSSSSSRKSQSRHTNVHAGTKQKSNYATWKARELSLLIQEEEEEEVHTNTNTNTNTFNKSDKNSHDEWVMGKMSCSGLHAIPILPTTTRDEFKSLSQFTSSLGGHVGYCARDGGIPCCQVVRNEGNPSVAKDGEIVKVDLLLKHAIEQGYNGYNDFGHVVNHPMEPTKVEVASTSKASTSKVHVHPRTTHVVESELSPPLPKSVSSNVKNPYISSIVEVPIPVPIHVHAHVPLLQTDESFSVPSARRMFDIMAENDCLPSYDCHRCLVRQDAQDFKSQCSTCEQDCGCYCKMLCRIRPRPKTIAKECHVLVPLIKSNKNALRLIPKKIHQTYFEEVTREKYPNFSRLVSSWKLSGNEWEYNFYDNAASEEFLSQYFPPEVREAYDALVPGAYKADLFRYCVLLIHGGIYADVDVLLSTDLDKFLENDVGFAVPVDEPGRPQGSGCCLWNGLLAVAPGHPFIAKAIEMVVNIIRNRYTAVDIDDMLCPNPNLDHSHSWDLLFVTGPCILGGAVNSVLGRHIQSEIAPGEMNIWNMPFAKKDDLILSSIPGRTIILGQNKTDMGSHRFNWIERNFIVATTDMPDYDDRKDAKHYSESTRENKRVLFGLKNVYKDLTPANEMIKIVVNQ